MVMGGPQTARTPERIESDRHERNAWLFAAAMVFGCSIPIGAAILFRSPASTPGISDAGATPPAPRATPSQPGH